MEVKLKVVAIDETEHWSEEVVAKTGKISNLYLYDPTVATHCCEITPSFELTPFGFVTEREIDDDTDEVVRSNFDTGPMYVHCTQAEKFRNTVDVKWDFDEDFDKESDYLEPVLDFLVGNPPYIPAL